MQNNTNQPNTFPCMPRVPQERTPIIEHPTVTQNIYKRITITVKNIFIMAALIFILMTLSAVITDLIIKSNKEKPSHIQENKIEDGPTCPIFDVPYKNGVRQC